MNVQRKRRLYFITLLIFGFGLATTLALYALRQNINLYFTPRQLVENKPSTNHLFRLGGMVVKGSVHHGENLNVRFTLTDFHSNCDVEYQGILPALFREGQGIVVEGRLNSTGVFVADQVLAKHDANYRPPAIPAENSGNRFLVLNPAHWQSQLLGMKGENRDSPPYDPPSRKVEFPSAGTPNRSSLIPVREKS